ncbi:MAG: response regulator transcription factor [Mariprofundaceae bacterium]|nr:response regulator transcription factor [Mariprofundaceae bacterium]
MDEKIQRVLLLEDHPDAQQWLCDAIHIAFGADTQVDITSLVKDSLALADSHMYDLVVADLHLPDGTGTALVKHIKMKSNPCFCVVATIFSDNQHLFPALKAGADGYLLKDEGKEDIALMLQGILEGKPPISAMVAQQMLHHFHQAAPAEEADDSLMLTNREREILLYISKGMSTKECAELMSISYHTASEYIQNVYRKLDVHSRVEATLEAVRMGFT